MTSIARAAAAVAAFIALTALPAIAHADDPTAADAPSDPPATEPPRRRMFEFAARLAARGDFLRVYDVSLFMAGAEVSFGAEGRWQGIYGSLELLAGRTTEGLFVTDVAATATYEIHFVGVRLAVGAGPMELAIRRATNGDFLSSLGVRGVVRAGYDFGARGAPFVALQAEAEFLDASAVPLGVGAALGWRF